MIRSPHHKDSFYFRSFRMFLSVRTGLYTGGKLKDTTIQSSTSTEAKKHTKTRPQAVTITWKWQACTEPEVMLGLGTGREVLNCCEPEPSNGLDWESTLHVSLSTQLHTVECGCELRWGWYHENTSREPVSNSLFIYKTPLCVVVLLSIKLLCQTLSDIKFVTLQHIR